MFFSILVPTRNRPDLLQNLINSITKTTKDINSIELLIAWDYDDKSMWQFIKTFSSLSWVRFYGRVRGKNMAKDYHNWLYEKSTGEIIIVGNDDIEFQTTHWDEVILQGVENRKNADELIYINSNENNLGSGYVAPWASFPILSRKTCQVLGYCMNPCYCGYSADEFLWRVFTMAGREINMKSCIVIQHLHSSLGKRNRDDTENNMFELTKANNTTQNLRDFALCCLLDYITKFNKFYEFKEKEFPLIAL